MAPGDMYANKPMNEGLMLGRTLDDRRHASNPRDVKPMKFFELGKKGMKTSRRAKLGKNQGALARDPRHADANLSPAMTDNRSQGQ